MFRNSTSFPRGKSFPGDVVQYVDAVLVATSQHGNTPNISYMAINLIGPPVRFPDHGDHSESYLLPTFGTWQQEVPSYTPEFGVGNVTGRDRTPVHDFVTVTFEQEVYASFIQLFETYNPSAVYRIWAAVDGDDPWALLWDVRDDPDAADPDQGVARNLCVWPNLIPHRTNQLRIEFSTLHLPYLAGLEGIMMYGYREGPFSDRCVVSTDVFAPLEEDAQATTDTDTDIQLLDLPDECLYQIVSNLDLPTLRVVGRVCQRFARIASDTRLYREVNLRVWWWRANTDLLEFVRERCDRIRKLDLSWCGSRGAFAPGTVRRFLRQHGATLTHLRMNALTVEPAELRPLDEYCPRLTELSMRNLVIDDRWHLAGLRWLTRLDLSYVSIRSDRLEALLTNTRSMQHLAISYSPQLVMESVAKVIGRHNQALVSLKAVKTQQWSGVGLEALYNCALLEELDVGWMTLRFNGLLSLAPVHWPRLKRLSLSSIRCVSSEDVCQIAQHCPLLEQLDLMGCIRVEESAVRAVLKWCPRLRLIDLTYCTRIRLDFAREIRERYAGVCVLFKGRPNN